MPQFIAGIGKLFSVVKGFLAAHKAIAFIVKLGVSMAASYAINKLLAPKLPKDMIGGNPLQMSRDPLTPRRVIYGAGRYSGPILFAHVSGSKNEYIHFIVALAGHEVEDIGATFWFDDKQVTVPAGGNTTTDADFGALTLINRHRGQAGQTADSTLTAALPSLWTSAHKLEGIAYLMLRLKWDQDKFPGGLPNITALVRGKKCYDPRDTVTRWTQNPALCLRDFLTDTTYGLRAESGEIDDASFIAAANICDEAVAIATSFTLLGDVTSGVRQIECADLTGIVPGLAVSGTGIAVGSIVESVDAVAGTFTVSRDPTATNAGVTLSFGDAEPRYVINGAFDTDAQPATVIEYILATMAGTLVYVGGKWHVKAGAYEAPTVTLDEDDLRGGISVQTADSTRDAINGVKGTFSNPVEKFQLTDFAAVSNATYLAEDDGIELWRDVTMPFVTSHSQAQRLAKIELERARRDVTVVLPCKLTALRVQAGDTFGLTNARLGWTNKPFLLTKFNFAIAEDGSLGCDIIARETDSTVWDWTATGEDGEEVPYDPSDDPENPPFPPDGELEYPDLLVLLITPGLECRSRGGTATLCGFSEYTSPSTPPKKYLRETISGEVCWQYYHPNAGACDQNFRHATKWLFSGYRLYDPVAACGGPPDDNTVRTVLKAPAGGGEGDGPEAGCAAAVFESSTTATLFGDIDEETPTMRHADASEPCQFIPSAFEAFNKDLLITGETQTDLTQEDTEEDAMNRLRATMDWPPDDEGWIAAGSIECGNLLCCTAYWQDRTSGFTVAFQDSQFRVSVPTLGSEAMYYIEVDIYRRAYGSSDPWVKVFTLVFLEQSDVGGLLQFKADIPNARGYETQAGNDNDDDVRVYE